MSLTVLSIPILIWQIRTTTQHKIRITKHNLINRTLLRRKQKSDPASHRPHPSSCACPRRRPPWCPPQAPAAPSFTMPSTATAASPPFYSTSQTLTVQSAPPDTSTVDFIAKKAQAPNPSHPMTPHSLDPPSRLKIPMGNIPHVIRTCEHLPIRRTLQTRNIAQMAREHPHRRPLLDILILYCVPSSS